MKRFIRTIFGMRSDMSISFYMIDLIFRRILRQNAGVAWAVHHTSTVRCPERLKAGLHTYPGDSPGVYISAYNGVEVGDYTNIGPNVSIISDNHNYIDNSLPERAGPVKIGKFCWLGAHVTILPEVKLGDFTIVGAGAVVTKSFEEGYCVIAGNPAKIIKYLNKESCISFAGSKEK